MKRSTATLHGQRIAYVRAEGTGVPILLVHGVGSSIETWDDIPERLERAGRPVLAIDLPGHGESGAAHGDYSLGAHANAIRDLLDHLGIDTVHLVGHSLGGGVSLQFAYQYPLRIESLTLVSSGGLGPDVGARLRAATLPGAEVVLRVVSSPRVTRAGGWIGRQLARVGKDVEALGPRAMQRLADLQDADRLTAFLGSLRSVVGPDGQRVSAVAKMGLLDPTRVLIVWGELDPMLPTEHGIAAHERMPGSRFVLIPGADHHPHSAEPELFTAALLEHVGRVNHLRAVPA